MSQNNFATTEEIKYASTILLNGQEFEDEKIDIIKCNESKDIKACPGSGKTTTLLAKLIVLANQMPLEMNKGICVLTHTNVAINEIKNKLGIKSEILFRYPNHFGTIQSFVDKFLAIPYSSNLKIGRIKKISDDIYYKSLERSFNARINKIKDSELYKKIWYFLLNNSEDNNHWNFLYSIRLGIENGKFEVLRDKSNILKFNKPKKKNQKTYTDWTEIEKEEIKTWLIDTITNVHEYYNVISYQDAYLFAKKYLTKIPSLKDAFSERFRYVFIDEMQDTDNYQLDIVNSVFNKSKSIVQQFGDPLQSI